MVKWRNNKGFTLMEVLISIAMIGILFLPLLTFFSHGAKTNANAKGIQRANEVAASVMEQTRAYDTLDDMVAAGYVETSSGSGIYSCVITGLKNDNKDYTAKVEVDAHVFSGLNQEKIYSIAPLGAGSTVMAAEGDCYTQNVITEYQARLSSVGVHVSFSEVAKHLEKRIKIEITDQRIDAGTGTDILSGNFVNVRIYSKYTIKDATGDFEKLSGDPGITENDIYNESVDFTKLKGIYVFYDYDITNNASDNIFQGIDVSVDMKDSDRFVNPLDSNFTVYALCQQIYNAESKSALTGDEMTIYAGTNPDCKTDFTTFTNNSVNNIKIFSNFANNINGIPGSIKNMDEIIEKIAVNRLSKITVKIYEGTSVSAGNEKVTLDSTRGE